MRSVEGLVVGVAYCNSKGAFQKNDFNSDCYMGVAFLMVLHLATEGAV